MPNVLSKLKNSESGATAIEYALIVGLVFLVIVSSVQLLGSKVSGTLYDKLAQLL
ncbi:MAG: Flp family type IVb pilin [Bdellovibrionales bacterium]